MKKIFVTIAFLAALQLQAQVTFSPGTFTAEDEVTLTVDVTGTNMAGQSEAYIWIWSNPGGKGPGMTPTAKIGEWGNALPFAKMTAAGTNKWSYKFTGTTLFGLTPGELNDFGFLVKAKDGSKQTGDYKPFAFDPLIFTPSMLRIFPSKVGRDDVITLNFDRSFGGTVFEQRMTPTSVTITMYDDQNQQVGFSVTTDAVRKTAENIWSASFIPTRMFAPPAAGRKLKRFTYRFNGTIPGPTGGTNATMSSEASVEFTEMK